MVMRHAIFGDTKNVNKMYIVPESEVVIELHREPGGGRQYVVAKFKGQNVEIPAGTVVNFTELAVVTEKGGFSYEQMRGDQTPAKPGIVQ